MKRETEPALRVVESLAEIPSGEWNALAADHPFLRHEVFAALHETRCACEETGWLPQFLALSRDGRIDGVMPLYLKSHSYGEYVFDWAWADAYERHGLSYYPKLLSAIPFSPVTGPRLLARDDQTRTLLLGAALELARQTSSLHVLYPPEPEARVMEAAGMMLRRGVQFHWRNPGYRSFEEFLATLNHAKRKKIRQERRKASEAGMSFRRLVGNEIRHEDWVFFTRCYNRTYRAHYSTPYLNLAFFERLGAVLPGNVLLVIAERDGMPFASALNVFTDDVLYGRYWGALGFLPALHFEVCYYQTMEFCIDRGIGLFEGGAQGEHKLSRGFLPVETWSAHWLRHPRFADAIGEFLAREGRGIEHYIDELNDRSPFKNQD